MCARWHRGYAYYVFFFFNPSFSHFFFLSTTYSVDIESDTEVLGCSAGGTPVTKLSLISSLR